ncbi:MAG TPA: SRPBCC family protein [Steroidobacteraceae bacterium]|nr:SRPBCC family protein [Steroidobacteraceae bacterium]
MLRKIVGIIVVALIALVAGAYMLPQVIHVERSTVIARPAASVFPYINSLRKANEWAPWIAYDPNVKMTYTGAEEGQGAKMSWTGNDKVGTGSQEITQSVPNRKVASDVRFGGQAPAKAALTLTTTDAGTKVVWSLEINLGNNPIARYVGTTLDAKVGADYERGLAKLKSLVESAPAPDAAAQPASAPTTSANAPTK